MKVFNSFQEVLASQCSTGNANAENPGSLRNMSPILGTKKIADLEHNINYTFTESKSFGGEYRIMGQPSHLPPNAGTGSFYVAEGFKNRKDAEDKLSEYFQRAIVVQSYSDILPTQPPKKKMFGIF